MTNYVFIGDIHSQSNHLKNAVNWVQQNVEDYFIIFLGDIFDSRTEFSDSYEVYQIIRELESNQRAIVIQSNHQDKLIRYLKGNPVNLNYGIDRTIEDFGYNTDNHLIDKEELLQWLQSMPYCVAIKDSDGLEYRAAHACFPMKVYVPNQYEGVYCVNEVSRKSKDKVLYGPHRGSENSRIQWWNDLNDEKYDYYRNWVRVAGHYHTVCENIENGSLVIDAGCGKDDGKLAIYLVNEKTIKTFSGDT